MNFDDVPPLPQSSKNKAPDAAVTRRSFLSRGVAGAVAAAGGLGLGSGAVAPAATEAKEIGPLSRTTRASRAYRVRLKCALAEYRLAKPVHPTNGDEELFPTRIANFSKGLPHNQFGEVDPIAYDALLRALKTGEPADFDAIPHGVVTPQLRNKLVNPQSALAFDLEGADSHALVQPPPPAFSSAEIAGEMVELYWMALTRDVPFTEYSSDPLTQAAANDLSLLSDFRGPKVSGRVTPETLFRDDTPGSTVGPYISQFLLLPVPFGANYVEQQMLTVAPGVDFMTDYSEWLSIQRGNFPTAQSQFDPTRRYIRNGRDLSQWVHIDVLFQAYFHAMLILLTPPNAFDHNSSGLGAPFDLGNPYGGSLNQIGFGTFGGPHIATLLCEVATRALKAVWYQKWSVHRRLRPEVFAGRVHNHFTGARPYPIAAAEFQGTDALDTLASVNGGNGYLLPMAFPEGSPVHPSYGAGHATVAGACITILKAWFNEAFVIENPVVPSPDGLTLEAYTGGEPLTIGGELNKLASNVATGRNIAGVHWRSDAIESMKLGEAVAISVLRDQRLCYNEAFAGFSLTKFDGTQATV